VRWAFDHGLLLPAADREPLSSSKTGTLPAQRPSKRSRDCPGFEASSSFTVLLPVSAPEIAYLPVASIPPGALASLPAFGPREQEDDDAFSVFNDDPPSSKRLCRVFSTEDDFAGDQADSRLANVLPAGHGHEVLPSPVQWGPESFMDALGEEEVFC